MRDLRRVNRLRRRAQVRGELPECRQSLRDRHRVGLGRKCCYPGVHLRVDLAVASRADSPDLGDIYGGLTRIVKCHPPDNAPIAIADRQLSESGQPAMQGLTRLGVALQVQALLKGPPHNLRVSSMKTFQVIDCRLDEPDDY